jgi:hypothetical protein
MNYKDSRWAKQILDLQNDDGTWGLSFHSLSMPTENYPLTTEQALRRLRILGFTMNDAPIRRTFDYMTACLRGERKMDDTWEKQHDWGLYTKLMLSTWVKIFDSKNELALAFARRWAEVIEHAFMNGTYNHDAYRAAYVEEFDIEPRGGRELDFATFYHMHLLQGMLAPETERSLLSLAISKPEGIYYIYNRPLNVLPTVFSTKAASHYLAAVELLAAYDSAQEKLGFVVDWLYDNRDLKGQWDLGAKANDGVYFPLTDSWRKAEDRKSDCTFRITELLMKLGM